MSAVAFELVDNWEHPHILVAVATRKNVGNIRHLPEIESWIR